MIQEEEAGVVKEEEEEEEEEEEKDVGCGMFLWHELAREVQIPRFTSWAECAVSTVTCIFLHLSLKYKAISPHKRDPDFESAATRKIQYLSAR
jgi:hypothetical protein